MVDRGPEPDPNKVSVGPKSIPIELNEFFLNLTSDNFIFIYMFTYLFLLYMFSHFILF